MESLFQLNIPVQMISCTDTNGKITPMVFKFKDRSGEIITIKINQVKYAEYIYAGARFSCNAFINDVLKSFSLWYNFTSHDWRMNGLNL